MTKEQEIVGQVVRTKELIPDHGFATVTLRLDGKSVDFQACSDTRMKIIAGSPVVVKEFRPPNQVVVSVNLPTPC